MNSTIFTILRQEQQAGEILNNLHDNGFTNADISVLCLVKVREMALFRGEYLFPRALDWLANTEVVTFNHGGQFIVSGKFLGACKNPPDSDRRLCALLAQFGLSVDQSEKFVAKLRRGNVLLAVHPDSPASSLRAVTVLNMPSPIAVSD